MDFAVLGAGNGGQAMAAFLALQGYKVNLYNRSLKRIKSIKDKGEVELKGVFNGTAKLNKVTTNIKEAVSGVEMILIVTPAVAHESLANQLTPYLEDGQKMILNPGRTGGALEFYNVLKSNICNKDILIAEAQTFLFASRITGSAQVTIYGIKNRVAIAAFPSNRTREIIDKLTEAVPQYSPVENVLKTSLDNIGAIFHPAPTLLNMAWIESTGGDFSYYQEGISPSVCRIMEKMDQERMKLAYTLGIDPLSACDWLRLSYGLEGNNLYELLQVNGQYKSINAPGNIKHRYVFEDIPMGLVPMASLAQKYDVKTPTINLIINLAELTFNVDFYEIGRTVDSLGLSNITVQDFKNLVNTGYQDNVEILPNIKKKYYRNLNNYVYTKFDEYRKEVE